MSGVLHLTSQHSVRRACTASSLQTNIGSLKHIALMPIQPLVVMKRVFDIVVAFLGLSLLLPLLLLVAFLIKLDTPGPIFFRQERIGKRFRPFFIYKFRTMGHDAPQKGGLITIGADPRITRMGRILRKTKIDELPQLLNILKGEMSFVGPRPEVPRYVEMFRRDYEEILNVLPGITDIASLKYRDEAEVLRHAENPEEEYVRHILPDKIRLAKDYLRQSSLCFDLSLIFKTLLALARKRDHSHERGPS